MSRPGLYANIHAKRKRGEKMREEKEKKNLSWAVEWLAVDLVTKMVLKNQV